MPKLFHDLEIIMVNTDLELKNFMHRTSFYTGHFSSHNHTKEDNYTIAIPDFILKTGYELIETICHELEHYNLTKLLRRLDILYDERWKMYSQAPEHILSDNVW